MNNKTPQGFAFFLCFPFLIVSMLVNSQRPMRYILLSARLVAIVAAVWPAARSCPCNVHNNRHMSPS